jgi:replicative DNA helicase
MSSETTTNKTSSAPDAHIAPHSKESEMMVLGCMLSSADSLMSGCDALIASDFYHTEHKVIFRALGALYKADKPADVHLAAEELKRENKLTQCGGVSYLTELAQFAGTSAFIDEYTKIVKEKAMLRSMIDAAKVIERKAIQAPSDVSRLLDEAQQEFYTISQRSKRPEGITLRDLSLGNSGPTGASYLKALEERQEAFATKGPDSLGVTGIPTGFVDLDKMINGLGRSNLIIVAGRPAMGKTALAINIAEQICYSSGHSIGFFSLEMSADQVLGRLISSLSGVEGEKLATGNLTGPEYQQVVSAVERIQTSKSQFIVDDQPGLKVTDLRARARRMKEVYDIDLLVIDYLQLLEGSGTSRSQESRQNEIAEISRMLKTLARELDIPIICPSQLSRKVEDRTGHRPMMSDLRESGSIEQDADVVLLLLRREYYDPMDKPGMAEVIVGKNRHGGTGSVHMTFRKELAQFANYIPADPLEG